MQQVILSTAFVVCLCGCMVGPDYHRPKADIRSAWNTDNTANSSVPGLATSRPSTVQQGIDEPDRWWTTLHDPTLDHLVERAVISNLNLQAAAARIREARAQTSGAKAGLFPTVRGVGEHDFNRAAGPLFPAEVGDYQFGALGFDAAWELDVFGGTRRAIEEAGDNQQAEVEARRDAIVSVLGEVCRIYVGLRTDQRRTAIAQEDIKVAQELLDLAKRRRVAGIGGDLDVVRAQAQVTTTSAELPRLDFQCRQAIHAISTLLGTPPDTLLPELSPAFSIPQPPDRVPVGLPSDLLRRRPDIRRVERQMAAATASIGVAEANLYPQFSLTGDLGVGATNTSSLFNWSSRYVSIGPSARWLLFDAGRVLADVDSRKSVREETLARYQQTILSATREVEDAIVAFDREQDTRDLDRETVESNVEAVRIASEQYANGVTGFLNVLDAERSLFASQDALARSDGEITVDLVALYKALGGGWETTEHAAPVVPQTSRPPMPAAEMAGR